jgi:hypothetical protein
LASKAIPAAGKTLRVTRNSIGLIGRNTNSKLEVKTRIQTDIGSFADFRSEGLSFQFDDAIVENQGGVKDSRLRGRKENGNFTRLGA